MQGQIALFSEAVPLAQFDGETYEPKLDQQRLSTQLEAIRELMLDNVWRTLPQIVLALRSRKGIHATEPGVSARLRDLRKSKFGAYNVERRRQSDHFFEYRIAPSAEVQD